MKRSEMIEILHKYTSTLNIVNHDETIAEHILFLVEESGMQPPDYYSCAIKHEWEEE